MTKHGAPDWYKYRRNSVTFPVDDLAELAARLNSITTFDRRGDVIRLEDFSHGLNRWIQDLPAADALATTSPVSFISSGYSAKLTASAGANNYARLYYPLSYPRTGPFGLEMSFTIEANHSYFTTMIYAFDGTDIHQYQILYLEATSTLYYLTTNLALVALAPIVPVHHNSRCFNTLKLVTDPLNDTYTRVMLNNHAWPLTDIPCYTTPDPTTPHIRFYLEYRSDAGTNPVGYLDNVIITQDEP